MGTHGPAGLRDWCVLGWPRSLIAPMSVEEERTVNPWTNKGTLVRISIGLEDVADLWSDLEPFLRGARRGCGRTRRLTFALRRHRVPADTHLGWEGRGAAEGGQTLETCGVVSWPRGLSHSPGSFLSPDFSSMGYGPNAGKRIE